MHRVKVGVRHAVAFLIHDAAYGIARTAVGGRRRDVVLQEAVGSRDVGDRDLGELTESVVGVARHPIHERHPARGRDLRGLGGDMVKAVRRVGVARDQVLAGSQGLGPEDLFQIVLHMGGRLACRVVGIGRVEAPAVLDVGEVAGSIEGPDDGRDAGVLGDHRGIGDLEGEGSPGVDRVERQEEAPVCQEGRPGDVRRLALLAIERDLRLMRGRRDGVALAVEQVRRRGVGDRLEAAVRQVG